ncbi:MAG: proline iminopeptidase-family hydrolase [Saprospiraceae bacterium]|nr:proline iminopeptidase-family hydrolase [Saprospiraceae bacterium]
MDNHCNSGQIELTCKTLLLIFIFLSWTSCQKQDAPPRGADYFAQTGNEVQTGGVQIVNVRAGTTTYKIWTKRVGNNPHLKLLLLNGGPGATHEYFECMESFLPKEQIEFIYYDQLGTGNSDHPEDMSLWDLSRFVDELEQVRQALGLNKENFILLGHSWGGILAMEYALKYPDNLKALIISNMMSDAKAYDQYANDVLAKKLPAAIVDTIRQIEAAGDFENPKYMELLMPHFYNQFICRLPMDQWPEPMVRSLGKINQELYVTMQGPSEFGIAGRLETWDRSKDLVDIKVPTLVIGATHDTMDPNHMKWMSEQIPNGTFLLCSSGSHMSMYDDQQVYFSGLIAFITGLSNK